MDLILKILMLFGGIFFLLILVANFLMKGFPHIPGDVYIERPGLSFKIPLVSAIVLTMIITILMGYFGLR